MTAAADLDTAFQALADPTRRGVIDLLRTEPRRAGELSRRLETSRPAMSRHLRVLRESGLVEERMSPEDARGRVYRLRKEPFDALHRWLDEIEAFWSDQLESFRLHAESKIESKAESKTASKTASKTESKAASKTASKARSKAATATKRGKA